MFVRRVTKGAQVDIPPSFVRKIEADQGLLEDIYNSRKL